MTVGVRLSGRGTAAVIAIALAVALAAAAGNAVAGGVREKPGQPAQAAVGPDHSGSHTLGAVPLPSPPGTTEHASIASNGRQGNAASGGVNALLPSAKPNQAISADGRWVAFVSAATNLTPGGANPAGGVFLRDRQTGTTVAIPWVDGGPFPSTVAAAEPSISADGSVVAFTAIVGATSSGGTLVGTTPIPYVLAWDRQSNQTQVVSVDSTGKAAPGWQPSVSADGRYVAYTSAPAATATPTPTPIPDTTTPVMSNLTASYYGCISYPGSSTISVDASDPDDGVAGVVLYYTPQGGSTYTQGMSYNPGTGHWEGTLTTQSGWANGQIVYYVRGYDTHGNYSAPFYPASTYYLSFSGAGCIF